MKRVVSLVAALALAVGAFAPAAFASDAGYGQTDLISLEDLDQETFDNYLAKFYSQDYPTYGVLDLIRDTFQGGLSNASGLNDSAWSWALDLVDNASDAGIEIGLWLQGIQIDPNTGKVIYPDDYLTDYAKQQLDTQLKTTPAGGEFDINGHTWLQVSFPYHIDFSPYNVTITEFQALNSGGNFSGNVSSSVYVSRFGNNTAVCSWVAFNSSSATALYGRSNGNNYISNVSGRFAVDGINYLCGQVSNRYPSGINSQYSDFASARNDFYSNFSSITGGGDPYWNGSGYYSDHQDSFSINLPSLPSTNWGNLSKYYYTTYGDDIIEGDVNRYYYNIANNFVPYEISYELPYWLINGSTDILNFDYSLELPTAELSTLPADFEGGSNFWDSSFGMLGGFSSFILLGLSFALVGLFFKD